MKKLIHKIAKFIFPSHCVVCQQTGTLLCDACRSEIPLAMSVEYVAGYQTTSSTSYQNKYLKKLLWYGKYRHSVEALEILSDWLVEAIWFGLEDTEVTFLNSTPIILVPVPMSRGHLRTRGKNHLQTLIEILITKYPGQFTSGNHIIEKISETKTQVSCRNRTERLNNLKNAFRLKEPKKYSGQIICVIDDLITTGTTFTEIFKIIAPTKPSLLLGASIAHG